MFMRSVTLYFRELVKLKQCGYLGKDTFIILSFYTISMEAEYLEKKFMALAFILSALKSALFFLTRRARFSVVFRNSMKD